MDTRPKINCDQQAALGILGPLYDLGKYSIDYTDGPSAAFTSAALYGENVSKMQKSGSCFAAPAVKTMSYVGYAGRAFDAVGGLMSVSQGIRKDIDFRCEIGVETINAIVKSTAQISAAGVAGTIAGGAALVFLAPAGLVAAASVGAIAGAAVVGGFAAAAAGYTVGKAYDALVSWVS